MYRILGKPTCDLDECIAFWANRPAISTTVTYSGQADLPPTSPPGQVLDRAVQVPVHSPVFQDRSCIDLYRYLSAPLFPGQALYRPLQAPIRTPVSPDRSCVDLYRQLCVQTCAGTYPDQARDTDSYLYRCVQVATCIGVYRYLCRQTMWAGQGPV